MIQRTGGSGRRLMLMRHAKAEPYGPSDRERPLTRSGRRDAAAVGSWLAQQGFAPDHVLVSRAARATETCTELRAAAGFEVEPDIRAELYGAEAEEILDTIAQVPPEVTSLLYVGHNPGVQAVAATLAGAGEQLALQSLLTGFPTSGVAVYDVPVLWAELGEGKARLEEFYVGRA